MDDLALVDEDAALRSVLVRVEEVALAVVETARTVKDVTRAVDGAVEEEEVTSEVVDGEDAVWAVLVAVGAGLGGVVFVPDAVGTVGRTLGVGCWECRPSNTTEPAKAMNATTRTTATKSCHSSRERVKGDTRLSSHSF
ncbi:MAG: hypothetical protein M1296_04810 [Chloroflexi bacterium]|nr:hypothetical protein [Chloroflexota bacterium]